MVTVERDGADNLLANVGRAGIKTRRNSLGCHGIQSRLDQQTLRASTQFADGLALRSHSIAQGSYSTFRSVSLG